ncbi:MAG: hypothetical protein HY420_00010 [Candidatus Kerfeldbacteria bacterium]|nr:hypothetical protein [Candidatus Kerfeldbacteria bacterium]
MPKGKMTLEKLAGMVKQGFDAMDVRFTRLEDRVTAIEQRLDAIEDRLDKIEDRLDKVKLKSLPFADSCTQSSMNVSLTSWNGGSKR